MPPSRPFLVAFLLCLQHVCSLAFAVDKRSIGTGRRQLADALRFIQEKQRKIREAPPSNSYGYPDEYFLPMEPNDRNQQESESALLDEILANNNQGDPDILEPAATKDTESEEVSDQELENILGDTDEAVTEKPENDKRIPYDLRSDPREGKGSYPTLSDDDVAKLIGTAEDEEQSALSDDDSDSLNSENAASEASTVQPVSEEEVEDILGDADNDMEQEPIPDETTLNKEYILSPYMDTLPTVGMSNAKRKRSGIPPDDRKKKRAVPENMLSPEDLNREFIKKFIQLEDDENTQLANALNMATYSQVMGSERYIPEEMEYLKKAIEDEEAIQALKSSFGVSTANEDRDIDMRKKSYPNEEEFLQPNDEDNETEEEVNGVLADRFRKYFMRSNLYPNLDKGASEPEEENERDSAIDQGGRWYNGPVDLSQEGISNEELELNPFLRDLWEKYKAGRMDKREQDFSDEEEFDTSPTDTDSVLHDYVSKLSPRKKEELKAEVVQALAELAPIAEATCPAVQELTDNCGFLKRYKLDLDDEATDLCNRHRVCYSCGSVNGMTADQCDMGYLEEAEKLCRADPACKKDVSDLYVLMLTDHNFVNAEYAPNVCTDECAMDFVYGVYKRK